MRAEALALDGLAAFRLTRLVTQDSLTLPYREAVIGHGGLPAELVTCSWCVGIWAAAAIALAGRCGAPGRLGVRVLAVGALAGLLADRT